MRTFKPYVWLRTLYTLGFGLALPFIIGNLLKKSLKNKGYRQNLLQRFGFVKTKTDQKPIDLWIHAVSMGEALSALILIEALLKAQAHLNILLTCTTPSAYQQIYARLGSKVLQSYLPFDLPWCLNNLYKRLRPRALILIESELWPNLIHLCKQYRVPVIVANGRISDRSFKRWQQYSWFGKHLLQGLSLVAAQSQQDFERFLSLGMDPNKLKKFGNIKFDQQVSPNIQTLALLFKKKVGLDRPIWVAASTHDFEEEIILKAHTQLLLKYPNALLILVPRHPERSASILKQISTFGLLGHLRSSASESLEDINVLLGNTLGELKLFYAAAEVAFVGGSLVPRGGHNMLEPARAGAAIMMGPNYQNFREIAEAMNQSGAMQIVQNEQDLVQLLETWFKDPITRANCQTKAKEFIAKHQGASGRLVQELNYLGII